MCLCHKLIRFNVICDMLLVKTDGGMFHCIGISMQVSLSCHYLGVNYGRIIRGQLLPNRTAIHIPVLTNMSADDNATEHATKK